MYEFKHHPSSMGIQRGNFDFRSLESFALKFFVESPRLVTLILHAGLMETTPIHCYEDGARKVHKFLVPKQSLNMHFSHSGLAFSTVKVFSEEGELLWLVVCVRNRQGFLLPEFVLDKEGKQQRLSFGKKRLARCIAEPCTKFSRRMSIR